MIASLREDVRAMLDRDPAARSAVEVALCYAGLHAIWGYRLANRLWRGGHPLVARVLSQLVRAATGVEIHPAASIGRRVTIDHGMGVVIGETAVVGDDVHLYHGVTLGGVAGEAVKRHPTVGDRVEIGANATLIGDVTVGDDATVGAGAVVVDAVEAGSTVVGVPARPIE